MHSTPQIPASRTKLVDSDATPTRLWFQFFSALYRDAQKGFGYFSSAATQTLPAGSPTGVTFDTVGVAKSCDIGTPSSRVVVSRDGWYTISVTLSFTSSIMTSDDVKVWFKLNGIDIPGSTRFVSPRKQAAAVTWASSPTFEISAELAPRDYVEVYCLSTSGGIDLTAAASSSPPQYPSATSASLIINQVV